MKIGDLARRHAVPVETIRYYETEKLLPPAERTASNYRVYGPAHDDRLRFILNCRALDMTLEEIRALLTYHDTPTSDCAPVTQILDEHIGHVAKRVSEMRLLEKQLRSLRSACGQAKASGSCGILKSLRVATTPRSPSNVGAHSRRRGS